MGVAQLLPRRLQSDGGGAEKWNPGAAIVLHELMYSKRH